MKVFERNTKIQEVQ